MSTKQRYNVLIFILVSRCISVMVSSPDKILATTASFISFGYLLKLISITWPSLVPIIPV